MYSNKRQQVYNSVVTFDRHVNKFIRQTKTCQIPSIKKRTSSGLAHFRTFDRFRLYQVGTLDKIDSWFKQIFIINYSKNVYF